MAGWPDPPPPPQPTMAVATPSEIAQRDTGQILHLGTGREIEKPERSAAGAVYLDRKSKNFIEIQ